MSAGQTATQNLLHPDISLARRLEGAEAESNSQFVDARAQVFPDSGAEWTTVAGAHCMFDGPASPCTQTFGLGMHQLPTSEDLQQIEDFFRKRGAPTFHEVCPLVD